MSPRRPRITVLANGDRGAQLVKALVASGFPPVCFVWHGNFFRNPVKELGLDHATSAHRMSSRSVEQWDIVRDLITKEGTDLGLVAGFTYMLPPAVLNVARHGFLNLHAGELPKYRGGSPLNWQIINGERSAGISVLRVASGIDDGPVVARARIDIGSQTTISDLHREANKLFPQLVLDVLANLEQALATATIQDERHSEYWHQRSDEDGRFDPRFISSANLERLIRAVTHPYPGAWATVEDKVLRIFRSQVSNARYRGTPGRILRLNAELPTLLLHDGALELVEYALDGNADALRNGMFVR